MDISPGDLHVLFFPLPFSTIMFTNPKTLLYRFRHQLFFLSFFVVPGYLH